MPLAIGISPGRPFFEPIAESRLMNENRLHESGFEGARPAVP